MPEETWIERMILQWHREVMKRSPSAPVEVNIGMSHEYFARLREEPPEYIIGVDEVGRGSIAGPVTVTAFMAPVDWELKGLKDSKRLTPEKRFEYLKKIVASGHISVTREQDHTSVDRWGINQAVQLAVEDCLEELREFYAPKFNKALIVCDGGLRARHINHAMFPKADDIVQHVSAASVVAKCTRDSWMSNDAHKKYPYYAFNENMGYGTKKHTEVLQEHGPCTIHRKSFLKTPQVGEEMTE